MMSTRVSVLVLAFAVTPRHAVAAAQHTVAQPTEQARALVGESLRGNASREYLGPSDVSAFGTSAAPTSATLRPPAPKRRSVSPMPAEDGYDPVRHSPEALRARHLIRAGGIALAVSLVLGISAIAMAASDPCDAKFGNGCQRDARARAAWTMGVPSLVSLVGGMTLLGIGVDRLRRLKASLHATSGGWGLVVSGKF